MEKFLGQEETNEHNFEVFFFPSSLDERSFILFLCVELIMLGEYWISFFFG
jgi:hypothetical protein